jgi:5-hydroxyisourate hydrolase-like protein (transthyretin family)
LRFLIFSFSKQSTKLKRRAYMSRMRIFKLLPAFFMALITLVSAFPSSVLAQGNSTEELPLPFIYMDGERIPLDDERVLNTIPVQAPKPPRTRAVSGAAPNVSRVSSLSGEFTRDPDVRMDGVEVSELRYIVLVDGVGYEAFCADPMLKGPESSGAVYQISGEANSQLRNALTNGYPINSEWSNVDTMSEDDRMWWVYVTRVAVAVANNQSRNFTGDEVTLNHARQLANGELVANNYPPIMVNGLKDAQDTGREITDENAQSQAFAVTHNRKTNEFHNPFRFEWADGTPDGAKLVVDGNVIATAPDNVDTIFGEDLTDFQIEMPNTEENAGKTAAVNLVGIHNEFADKIWLLQNPDEPDRWQDIVFYIPEVSASAAFSFLREPGIPEEAELRIIKRDSSGNGLSGAVFEITGPDGYSKEETSPANGAISLKGITPGDYTITEVTPPKDHKLAEPASVTVTITADDTGVVERVFVNEPEDEPEPTETAVKIQKIDALTRKNIPGALVRLQGMSAATATLPDGQIISFNNTGVNISQVLSSGATTTNGTVTDGVWTLDDLPYGMYMVYEERAPENYSLLPQHTAYGFFLAPPEIEVKVEMPELNFEGEANESEVTINISLGEDVEHSGGGGGDPAAGWNWNDSLTVTPPLPDFEIIENPVDNAVLISFENFPFGKIEVSKFDMVTEAPLEGAHIRIQGYFAEGNTNGMPIDRVQVTGSNGKTVFENLPAGQYTLTEIEAPGGYELDYTDHRSVSLTWGQTASTSFYNKPKTFLEVTKIDGDDSSKLLDGAVFRLTDPTTGEVWEGTTSGGKVRLGEGEGSYGNQLEAEKVYILTEIQAPPGYVLDPSPKEVVLAANNQLNTVTAKNFLKPILTVQKFDELTNKPLAGANFRLWRTEGETWSETQVTDENGVITWTDLDPGIYSIQEIDEPYGYFKDPARKEILLEGGDHKVLEFFNRPRPVLIIVKRDAVTGEPLQDVKFHVRRLEGETIGEFLTDENGRIELSPKTGYLLEEEIYRVTEITPPKDYLLDPVFVKDVMLKWHEPTELIFENILKPTLIFIKRNGLTGRGISDATYKVEYEGANGGATTLGTTYKTKCGLIVIPYVQPGWYVLTETIPAPGYSLPTNPVQRMYLAPGANSYTHDQTQNGLYVDPRTNPNSGQRGACGDWCGYLCSQLCAGNCGHPGGGNMSGGTDGKFGNLTITNGSGEPIGTITTPSDPGSNPVVPTLSAGTVTRNSNLSASVQFTSSAAGKYYYYVVSAGEAEPAISTAGLGASCAAGSNLVTVYMTSGAKDLYIKVKDASGNVSGALKIVVPAYTGQSEPADQPNFDNIVITGGTVVYLNPDPIFSGIRITFGS